MRNALLLSSVTLVVLAGACRDSRDSSPTAAPTAPVSAPVSPAEAGPPPLPPLAGVWLEPIGDGVGLVAIPLGAVARRPVVVSLHGAGGMAEWACGDWMGATEGYPFIVCPRTRAERKGQFASWTSVIEASERSQLALASARARYGAWMADEDPVYVGFSQGGEMAVLAADKGLMNWSALFVHEGGYRQAKGALAHLLVGAKPVVATCSTWGCGPLLPRTLGPQGKTVNYGPLGHSTGPVYLRLRADFADMVRGREEWAGFPALRRH